MASSPEPEMTLEPETSVFLLPEGEPENSTALSSAEPSGEPVGAPEIDVSVALLVAPPFGLIGLLLVGMLYLMITAWWKKRRLNELTPPPGDNKVGVILDGSTMRLGNVGDPDEKLDPCDVESMSTLKRHFNRPVSLIFITLPAVISLALCPCLLLLQLPLVTAFWPDGMTNINDAVGCFLAPAGLVYAVTFGFTFQSVLDKQRMITVTVSAEVGLLDQMLVMASRMKSLTCQKKLKIFKLVKTEVISIMQQVTGLRGMSSKDYLHEYSAGQIWGLVDVLQADDKSMENCDSTMMDKMISNLQELSTCASQRHMTLAYTVHPLLWLFLEMLGFFSFVGVMLIRTGSVQMDLMMCIITVFSISLLCYVVGDLDSPFSGHFRVDLGSLWHLVGKAEHFYREQQRATNTARLNGANQKAPSRSIPNLISSVTVPGMTSFGSDLDMNF